MYLFVIRVCKIIGIYEQQFSNEAEQWVSWNVLPFALVFQTCQTGIAYSEKKKNFEIPNKSTAV